MTITTESDDTVWDADTLGALGALARALNVPSAELQPTLEAIVRTALTTVPGTEDAGLILIRKGRLEPVVSTGLRPSRLDELQGELGEGPCRDAAASEEVLLVADLQRDERWPQLREAAAELGVVSMACVPLRVQSQLTGALSLYSSRDGAFERSDLALVEVFATLAALALADAQRADQLRTALSSRDVLGQAKGILMERLRIDADEAFRRLADASQRANVKVTAVAEHLVRTGELLGPGQRIP